MSLSENSVASVSSSDSPGIPISWKRPGHTRSEGQNVRKVDCGRDGRACGKHEPCGLLIRWVGRSYFTATTTATTATTAAAATTRATVGIHADAALSAELRSATGAGVRSLPPVASLSPGRPRAGNWARAVAGRLGR